MNEIGGEAPRVLTHFMAGDEIVMAVGSLGPDRHRPAVLVDRHEHDFGLGHLHPLAMAGRAGGRRRRSPPLGLDRDPDRHRRPADPHGFGVEIDDIAHNTGS